MANQNTIPSECEIKTLMTIYELTEKGEKPALQNIMNLLNEKNEREWKPQTVSTFLARLVKKGYIESTREGRFFYYTCKLSKEDFLQQYFEYSAGLLFNGNMDKMKQTVNKLIV